MLEFLAGLGLTYLILMGWLKWDGWRLDWLIERQNRRRQKQAQRARAMDKCCAPPVATPSLPVLVLRLAEQSRQRRVASRQQ